MASQRYLSRRAMGVLASLATLVLLVAAALGAPVSADSTTTANPVADSYVNQDAPSANYGTANHILVDGTPRKHGYLRFDLSTSSAKVLKATLRIYANSQSGVGYSVYQTGSSWNEKAIDYANAPARGAFVNFSGSFKANTWTSVDVTRAVKAGTQVGFELIPRNSTNINLASRESANPPQLVMTLAASAIPLVPTPATTPSPTPATPTQAASPTAKPTASPTAKPTASPTAKPTASPTATIPPTAGSPVLIGAGDICITSVIQNARATAALITARPSDAVFTLGDNSNETGTATQYANCYAPTWGAFLGRTHATVGNHDYMTSGAAPYYSYFGAAAGPAGKGYYSYNLANNWHVIVLNSECSEVGGCGAGSPEETFLRNDLAANSGKHILAMWHIPRFSSGSAHGDNPTYTAWWQDLYNAHADIVLDGHDHDYERFALQNPDGVADPNGIREFVVGTGGAGQRSFGTIRANSQVRSTGTFGVLQLTLGLHSYSWQFIPVAGKTFTDSGTQPTHS
jgi:cell division septation protein DedD